MSTPQSSAATHAPAHDARAPAEEPLAEESLQAHARRSFLSAAGAAVTAVLDAGIGFLQGLRKRAGGAQDANTEADTDGPGSRKDRPGGRRDAATPLAEAEAQAPNSKRRLRALLVYLSVLLAGGMGGGVLAYDLLEDLLVEQFAKSKGLEVTISKQSRSAATTQRALGKVQARRIEAEKTPDASAAEHTASAPEQQKKPDEAEKRLEPLLAAERARDALRFSPGSSGAAAPDAPPNAAPDAPPNAPPFKTGDCNVTPGNTAALKGCIEEFNR